MTPEMNITTEQLDDFPLLLEIMGRLGLPRHRGWCSPTWASCLSWRTVLGVV